MTNFTRRSALSAILATGTAGALGAVAHAEPADVTVTRYETIDLKRSSVRVLTPVPGGMSTGQFTVANESAYALPPGYTVTLRWDVTTPAEVGWNPGRQSYVSTTATPSSGGIRVDFDGATNASAGKPGLAHATVDHYQRPGLGIYGTWSGAHIAADGEHTHAKQRYRVTLVAPSKVLTYETVENREDGAMVTVKHVVTVKGGSWTTDQEL